MAVEIEYKFLVKEKIWDEIKKPEPIEIMQGYISRSEDKVVRVRIKGKKGFLTIKGSTNGITRTEYEYEIPLLDAQEMLDHMTDKYIQKHRYEIVEDGNTWEVDVFHGNLEGLILAELEVESEDAKFNKPSWIGMDVSNDHKYYNAVLIDRC